MEFFATSGVVFILGILCAVSAESRFDPDVVNQYHLFTRRNPTVSQPLLYQNAGILSASNYDPRLRTVVTLHNRGASAVAEFNQFLVPAFLASDDVNVIVVDWHDISNLALSDPDAVHESGQSVARFISWLKFLTGKPAEDFHIVGFSIGAQHAGITGRYVEGGVGYVTALDPNRSWADIEYRFRADDGLYTEVIFTSNQDGNVGHVNFYPNGGANMPGCTIEMMCSHSRAFYYMAEAIVSGGFTGTECATVEDAIAGTCDLPGRLQMGSRLPRIGVTGTYFLRTNAAPPFSIY